jgi:hypothetical protein
MKPFFITFCDFSLLFDDFCCACETEAFRLLILLVCSFVCLLVLLFVYVFVCLLVFCSLCVCVCVCVCACMQVSDADLMYVFTAFVDGRHVGTRR